MDFEKIDVSTLTEKDPIKVYSGKIGCMCGCKGKYSYPSNVDKAKAIEALGYDSIAISDIMVKKVLDIFKNNLDNIQKDTDYLYMENTDKNKCYAIYNAY